MDPVCYVVRERLWRDDIGVEEENLWIKKIKIGDEEIDVERYAIISFDPSTNPKEQEEVIVLTIQGVKRLGLPKDLFTLLETLKAIEREDPRVVEEIEVHIPRKWLESKCKVVITGECRGTS